MANSILVAWVLSLILIGFRLNTVYAQTPPPESTSKVKRVLLYNYNGGWNCAECITETQKVFFQMAQGKGFILDTTSTFYDLTTENLKRYQVIVWNNNHGGTYSVPLLKARDAVSDYILNGGGWLLVNIANEHNQTWPFVKNLIGPGTGGWQGNSIPATLVPDSAALNHPELRFVVNAMPDSIALRTNWLGVRESVEDSAHIKVLYRLKNASWINTDSNFIPEYSNHYIWASTQEKGRALSLPLGWFGGAGRTDIMAQADSAVPKLYWQGLRWLAGDYQSGCTNPEEPNFNPDARVHDGSCAALGIQDEKQNDRTQVKVIGRRAYFSESLDGERRVVLKNVQGKSVGFFDLTRSATSFDLPASLRTGLYILEVAGQKFRNQTRIFIP